jgi:acyl-CoA synthetase (AMP-forming)/AMP-acid ligase II
MTAMPARTLVEVVRAQADLRAPEIAYRFLPDGERETAALTFEQVDVEARAVAAQLQAEVERGDRALILAADGLDFVRAFLACQYAGVIAVPTYPLSPFSSARQIATLRAIAADSGARIVVTPAAGEQRAQVAELAPEVAELRWLAVDEVGRADADAFRPVDVRADDVSFLQYTSGSTSVPKGVIVTHERLLANERTVTECFGTRTSDTLVSWLPLFHDMGLIAVVIQTLCEGAEAVVMPPAAFVQRPARWLRAVTRYGGAVTGGPNFAYELCVRRIPEPEREGIDLSTVRCAFNGAEPVRAATLDAFAAAYRSHGFDERAWLPGYGLAECVVAVTAGPPGAGATIVDADADALRSGRLVPGGDRRLVSGGPAREDRIAIVDPDTRRRVAPGAIGEIWISRSYTATGYWGHPDATAETFGAHLADTGEGPFLRTGDLGAVHDGFLYVVGRIKDVIIVAGLNHYPQDIEATVEAVDPAVRKGCSAAFAVERDDREEIVVVAELKHAGDGSEPDVARLGRAIRAAVAADHGFELDDLVLAAPRSVPKTSSGKLARRACRAEYERGAIELAGAAPARAAGGVA